MFTICIARAMGLSREHINPIAHGAVFHDVGKMAIPDRILRKPGPPDAGRNAIMRQHCIRGYELVHKIPFLADAAEIVYSHHERYDGARYPRGFSLPDNVWLDLTKEIQSEASKRMQSPLPTMQQGARILICSLS